MRYLSNLMLASSMTAGRLGRQAGRGCVLCKIIASETPYNTAPLAEPLHRLSIWLGDVSERLQILSDRVESARIAYKYNEYKNI